MADPLPPVRIAALADLHFEKSSGSVKPLLAQIAEQADVLLLCGDLTDYGLAEEAQLLAKDFMGLKLPAIAVLGNHDYEANQQAEITQVLSDVGIKVLDGQAHEVLGIGFAGTKGFGGGFGIRTLEPWGERIIKQFVQEALDEALKLELALSRLHAKRRVALLHYAPVVSTVEGEPLEIYPYLGSSRLEEPLNRYEVSAVFHGHAHHGHAEGKTQQGISVYNVSLPLLKRQSPEFPVRIIELTPE